MADLTASDVTVALQHRLITGEPKRRQATATISFGDGAKTYPAAGVPLPAVSAFGFVRSLDRLTLVDPANANGLLYKYDAANRKVRIYNPTQQTGAAGNRAAIELAGGTDVVAATVLVAQVDGW